MPINDELTTAIFAGPPTNPPAITLPMFMNISAPPVAVKNEPSRMITTMNVAHTPSGVPNTPNVP